MQLASPVQFAAKFPSITAEMPYCFAKLHQRLFPDFGIDLTIPDFHGD
jgi:hypothetical protein